MEQVYWQLPPGTQTLGSGCVPLASSQPKPGGRRSAGLLDVSSNKGIFHDFSFWAPYFETKQGRRSLPIQTGSA